MNHHYISTACVHELHDKCRQSCKFCGVKCLCSCHAPRDQQITEAVEDAKPVCSSDTDPEAIIKAIVFAITRKE